MRAVMYGGGNIGRGFVGALLSRSGYEVTFIDVAEPVVSALSERRRYPVRYVSGDGWEDQWIENVTAVNGNDGEAAADAIARCDIMATAVGARILPYIAPNIVEGLRRRWAAGRGCLNIIICENLMNADRVLGELLESRLTEAERPLFRETVGLVEASIGRMVPVQTEEMKDGDPMRVCVERYGYLPVDRAAFKGGVPEIENMAPFAPFDFYVKRKLYIHNLGHAVCAYLGDCLGLEYISEAIDQPEIRLLVQNAMLESAGVLSEEYGVPLAELLRHITDLLHRFGNGALRDTCRRVGGDPARKLGPEDRLIGAASLALERGVTPVYIAVGAAAGLRRYLSEAGLAPSVENALQALTEVSGLERESRLAELILELYRLLPDGGTLTELRRAADGRKAAETRGVI